MFSTLLTPKTNEIVVYDYHGAQFGKNFFEEQLGLAFREMQRVLKPNGITTIVYAHKSTAGWETVINALLDSGLVVTAAWPLNTEMQSRLVAKETAALASSIYIVARKSPRQPTGFYNEVRAELRQHLNAKLHRLWEEGIGGADFFIAAIGSSIEIFGKYEKIMDYEGNLVRADRLLEEVRTIATDYAVRQILYIAPGLGLRDTPLPMGEGLGVRGNASESELSPLTRFYVLWRWNYGEAVLPFDEANKLAHPVGFNRLSRTEAGLQSTEPATLAHMQDFMRANNLQDAVGLDGKHHEIYLNDPRRVAPEKMKTILRHSVHPEPTGVPHHGRHQI